MKNTDQAQYKKNCEDQKIRVRKKSDIKFTARYFLQNVIVQLTENLIYLCLGIFYDKEAVNIKP